MASTPDSQSDDPPDILTPILPAVLPLDSSPETTSSSTPTPSDDSPPPPPNSPPPNSPPPESSPPPPPPSPPPNSPPPSPPLVSKTSPWQSKIISSPRPSKSSPPPPSSPPPNSPPPASPPPPSSPPPASPSPPNSPPPTSPPPPPIDSSPPVDYPPASSPPPPSPTPSLPSPTLSPPSLTPSLPSPTPSLPSSIPSPPSLPGFSPSPPLVVFSPSPIKYSSPPRPPASTPPPRPPTTSQHTRSAPRPSSKSSSASNVSVNPVPNSPPGNNQSAKTGISVGVVAGVFIVVFVLAILCLRRQKKKHTRFNSAYMMPSPYASTPSSGISFIKPTGGGGGSHLEFSPDNAGVGYSKTWFSYEELTAASGGFATQNILGRGGFGCVYKGSLQDGRVVAIKKLKDSSGQGDREFKAEVEIISRVHHRYLVSLVGYCITDFQRLLVYEFVPNGTLHYHLHSSSKPVMQWNFRVKVACGSARGITYLHEDCHPRIIHRDIKSANILIDNNFEAKVADFGLAKVAQELESNTHVSTRVMGTFGYMAPEYASSGKLTEKSDVFSFGVVLLEIITGRKPVDETRPLGDESLVEWARPFMTEALNNQNFDELADPRLQGNYDRGEMFRMIEAANACVRHSAVKRPRMSQVVRALDTMDELSDISNGMKPGQSGIYDSGEQSAQISLFQRMTFGTEEFSTEHQVMSQSSWSSGGRRGIAGDSSEQV